MTPSSFRRAWLGCRAFLDLLVRSNSFLSQTGWLESYAAKRSVGADGTNIPWFTYGAIHFLETRLKPTLRVFEYGSGGSTRWFAARVGEIVACEHEKEWADLFNTSAPANAKVIFCRLDDGYAEEITQQPEPFDLVVIDGRQRVQCARLATQHLTPGGVVLWDNSERDEYREGMAYLRDSGFRQIDFFGMAPIGPYASQTSIFYRDNNVLGI